MTKVFIAQTVDDREKEDVLAERTQIEMACRSKWEDCEIIPPCYDGDSGNGYSIPLIGKTVESMADADVVVFAPKWHDPSGCQVEHYIAHDFFDPKNIFVYDPKMPFASRICREEYSEAGAGELKAILGSYLARRGNLSRMGGAVKATMVKALDEIVFLDKEERLKKAGFFSLEEVEGYVSQVRKRKEECANNKE